MAKVSGGENLIAALQKYAGPKAVTLRVGFLENASYPDGTSVASVAAFNEFGVPSHNQPPRPFFRNMVAAKQSGWGDAVAQNLKAAHFDADTAMKRVGEGIKGQLQQSITELVSPPLAPSTVERKGSDKPLVDTGHMLASVDYDVKSS